MNNRSDKQQTVRELTVVAVGELLVFGLLCGAFAALGKLDAKVILGGAVGAVTAVLNYVLMAVGVWAAAARAEAGEPARAKRAVTLSMLARFGLMIAILVIGAKSGACNVIAMVIPLAAFRLLLFAAELFRKK